MNAATPLRSHRYLHQTRPGANATYRRRCENMTEVCDPAACQVTGGAHAHIAGKRHRRRGGESAKFFEGGSSHVLAPSVIGRICSLACLVEIPVGSKWCRGVHSHVFANTC